MQEFLTITNLKPECVVLTKEWVINNAFQKFNCIQNSTVINVHFPQYLF